MSISEFVQIFLSICGGVSIVGGAAAVILSRDTWKNSGICSNWLKHVPQLLERFVVQCIYEEDS